MKTKYFLQKNARYSHGIYWMGTDLNEGLAVGEQLAEGDEDDYHAWALYEYTEISFAALAGKEWAQCGHYSDLPHKMLTEFRKTYPEDVKIDE